MACQAVCKRQCGRKFHVGWVRRLPFVLSTASRCRQLCCRTLSPNPRGICRAPRIMFTEPASPIDTGFCRIGCRAGARSVRPISRAMSMYIHLAARAAYLPFPPSLPPSHNRAGGKFPLAGRTARLAIFFPVRTAAAWQANPMRWFVDRGSDVGYETYLELDACVDSPVHARLGRADQRKNIKKAKGLQVKSDNGTAWPIRCRS